MMNSQRSVGVGSLVAAGVWLLLAADVWACSVPVFRYALEQWPADPYPVVVFHRGSLSPADEALVGQLEQAAADPARKANLEIHTVDLAGTVSRQMHALWREQDSLALPAMVVRYPGAGRPTVWAGPLNEPSVKALIDSPARREVARRLVGGTSAVWVFVASGDSQKDTAAKAVLGDELKRLQQTLELPEPVDGQSNDSVDAAATATRSELKLSFSVLQLTRDDPAEGIFLNMLLRSEEDLEALSEPMAFPIFGRGRVLHALVGAGINQEMIAESCRFLVGPCSCQVKDLNPGTDLVMAIDWNGAVTGRLVDQETVAAMPGYLDPPTPAASVSVEPVTAERTNPVLSTGATNRNLVLVVVLGCIALSAATIILKLKRA